MDTLSQIPTETHVGNHFVSNYPPFSCWSPEEIPRLEETLNRSVSSSTPISLYLHIPFCRQRCHYCYFRVYPRRSPEDVDAYISKLLEELDLYLERPAINSRPFKTMYFGGGSPSYPSAEQLERLLTGLRVRLDCSELEEFTMECEPGTISSEKFKILKRAGVTRLSLGFQTLDDDILRYSGRDVQVRDCLEGFAEARRAGFDQLNIDLLAGLPGETDETWRTTIEQVRSLEPDCVTIYQLELTHNSNFYKSMEAGRRLAFPDWPTKRRWASEAFDVLEKAGYTIASGYMAVRDPNRWKFAYTVDHFWRGEDLLALGESSFGHIQGVHYQNVHTFQRYINLLDENQLPWRRAHVLSNEEKLRREVILQFKTGCLDLTYFREKFGVDLLEHFPDQINYLLRNNMLTIEKNALKLSRTALLDVDWWLPQFYLLKHQNLRYT